MAEPPGAPHRTTGSTLLHPLSGLLGIPLDQINFVACQLFALLAAFWFRVYLGPSHASSAVRHAFATLFGIYFAVFCFGWYSIHLFVLVMMNYGIMNMASIPNIHRYSFVVAMGYLTLCHISRIYIFHYGILTTDFSGKERPFVKIALHTGIAFDILLALERAIREVWADFLPADVNSRSYVNNLADINLQKKWTSLCACCISNAEQQQHS